MAKLQKFVPLSKMEEQSDGTLHVFGIVTAEVPDLENEVCDYEGTKPYYKAKAEALLKATSAIPGMTPSIMPMREMHQLKAIGAGRSIEFDDANKAIKMGFHVVDPTSVTKFKAGVLIGFSQGGDYVGPMIDDPEHKGCKRYIADPAEVSAVDSPCLPVALVESMKGRTVTLQKASGATEQIPLEIIPLDKARMTKMEREVAELTRLFKREFSEEERKKLADEGKALPDGSFPIVNEEDLKNAIHAYGRASDKAKAKKHIIARAKALGLTHLLPEDWTSEKARKAIGRACAKLALQKGLYEVGWLGSLIEELTWLCMQSEFEADMEQDESKVPEGLREAWKMLISEFKAMAEEEADEALAAGGQKSMKITDQAGLTKAAKTIGEHLEKHMEMHKALHEKLEGTLSKDHPIVKAHQAMMDHCEKCMKAATDAGSGEEPEEGDKVAPGADLIKAAVEAAVTPLKTELAALTDKMSKIAAPGAPHTGATGAAKSVTTAFDELVPAAVTH
jgi:hypothetical protein